jgi:glycosyltransferase involved in cell wall biosynthesis
MPPMDIVVLDNGSSSDICSSIREEIGKGVKFIGADFNHGAAWNFLRAASLVQSKYFLVMHDDDRLLPNFIERMYDFLSMNDNIIAVSCNASIIDNNGVSNGRTLIKKSKTKVQIFSDSAEMAIRYSKSFIPFPTVVYKRGFLEQIQIRHEFGKVLDAILLCELASLGPIAYLDEEPYEYRQHSGQDSYDLPFELLLKRNDWLLQTVKGNKKAYKQVNRNISKAETFWSIDGVFLNILKEKTLNNLFHNIVTHKTKHFRIRYIFKYLPAKIMNSSYLT